MKDCAVAKNNKREVLAAYETFFKLHHAFERVSSPVACFISKIQQFELLSFHSAWHQNRNAVSMKKSLSSWFLAVQPFQVYVYVHIC